MLFQTLSISAILLPTTIVGGRGPRMSIKLELLFSFNKTQEQSSPRGRFGPASNCDHSFWSKCSLSTWAHTKALRTPFQGSHYQSHGRLSLSLLHRLPLFHLPSTILQVPCKGSPYTVPLAPTLLISLRAYELQEDAVSLFGCKGTVPTAN